MSYPAGLAILRCAVCRTAMLVDPVNLSAILWHYPDGAHRVVPTERIVPATVDGEALETAVEAAGFQADMIGLSVRLQEIADDLGAVVARMERRFRP